MLRLIFGVSRPISRILSPKVCPNRNLLTQLSGVKQESSRNFTTILTPAIPKPSLLSNPKLQELSQNLVINRGLIKYSYRKGKRKSVKAVLRRFYRLDWGGWIRTKCGRKKKLWKKSAQRKRRLRQHVLCNSTQSTLLDKMAGPYWRRRRFYVEDPYEPYHTRDEYTYASKKPKPFYPPEG